LAEGKVPNVDAAFERFTGLSIGKFMAVGTAFSFSFAAVHEGRLTGPRSSVHPL
jgi:hypothetical protein